jgi:molybdopterin synthase catalytic subunit
VGARVIEITSKPVAAQFVIDRVKRSTHGAVVTFVGIVRESSEGKRVLYLEYEAYQEMARKKLEEISAEIQNRWGITDIDIIHRVGRIEVGDTAIVIAVGSAHRLEAFQACQYAIDRIKEIVPIWKKEFYEDGSSSWIGHT